MDSENGHGMVAARWEPRGWDQDGDGAGAAAWRWGARKRPGPGSPLSAGYPQPGSSSAPLTAGGAAPPALGRPQVAPSSLGHHRRHLPGAPRARRGRRRRTARGEWRREGTGKRPVLSPAPAPAAGTAGSVRCEPLAAFLRAPPPPRQAPAPWRRAEVASPSGGGGGGSGRGRRGGGRWRPHLRGTGPGASGAVALRQGGWRRSSVRLGAGAGRWAALGRGGRKASGPVALLGCDLCVLWASVNRSSSPRRGSSAALRPALPPVGVGREACPRLTFLGCADSCAWKPSEGVVL